MLQDAGAIILENCAADIRSWLFVLQMSDAVEGAAVMLYGVSLRYKESANCRLEANYGMRESHNSCLPACLCLPASTVLLFSDWRFLASGGSTEEECDMMPLMMLNNFKARGWLGLILGTRLWYPFWDADQDNDADFEKRVDAVAREIGDRGKPYAAPAPMGWSKVKETVAAPPSEPAPAPTAAPTAAAQAAGARAKRAEALSAVTPESQQTATAGASFAEFAAFFREERALLDAKLEKQRQEMDGKIEALLQAQRRVSEPQLEALQDRLQEMNAAGVLADDDLFPCEDIIADSAEVMATGGAAPDPLVRMVALSERLAADGPFARQLRRKFG